MLCMQQVDAEWQQLMRLQQQVHERELMVGRLITDSWCYRRPHHVSRLHLHSRNLEIQNSNFYPAPDMGTGYCNRAISLFLSLFISLSATLRENGWTDLHEIFREGVE